MGKCPIRVTVLKSNCGSGWSSLWVEVYLLYSVIVPVIVVPWEVVPR